MNLPVFEDPDARAPKSQLLTLKSFRDAGVTISDWARNNGFKPKLVHAVLRGELKCLRGESHRIAKELGMK